MGHITVKQLANDAFRIDIRGHQVLIDQPGSDEVGPTPVVNPPNRVPPELRSPLLAAIHQCTLTNSLRQPPQVEVELSSTAATVLSTADRASRG